MAYTKTRTDTQVFGKDLTLGGIDPQTGFGDVGAALVTLRRDDADVTSAHLIIQSKTADVADEVLTVEASALIAGNLTVNGVISGELEINVPVDTALPPDLTSDVGNLFYHSTERRFYVYGGGTGGEGGTGWYPAGLDLTTLTEKTTPDAADIVLIEDSADSFHKKKVQLSNISSAGLVMLNTSQIDKNSSGFAEIFGFKTNLRRAFPSGLKLQIKSFNSSGAVQGSYRLFNISDSVTVVSLNNTLGSLTPTIYESATVSSGSIPDAEKEYSFEHARIAGAGAGNRTSLIGALLRKP